MVDFLVPKGNEDDLLKTARSFGQEDVVMLYSLKDFSNLRNNSASDNYKKGILFKDEASLKLVRKALSMSDYVVVRESEQMRSIMEACPGIYLYGLEFNARSDFVHFRNSGINHILLDIAKKNNISFLFNFSDFLDLDNKKKAIVLGRLKQNLLMFQKYKVNFAFASFASEQSRIKKDLSVFARLIESNKIPLIK
jgi:RNase P/RNase MRP subunit p30